MKKIVSVLLAMLMLLSVAPFAVAEEKESVVDVKKMISEINESVNFDKAEAASILDEYTDKVATMSNEETFVSDIYTYKIDKNGGAVIVGTDTNASGNIVVPAKLDGKTVVSADSSAFKDCTKIKGITFPGSIETVKADLTKLKNLEFVNIPTAADCNGINLPSESSTIDVGNTTISVKWSKSDKTTTINIGSGIADFMKVYNLRSAYSSSVEKITVSEGNTSFRLLNGVLYSSDITALYLYPSLSKAKSYVMPDTVCFTYETADFADTLYSAHNLEEITIGKDFNLGFETVEEYREFCDDYSESYSEEILLYFLPNMILQLGDGASHTCLFPYAPNLKSIKVSPDHEYLTGKDGILCLKDDKYDVILVYPGSKKGTITLKDNAIVYNYAFLSLQESHEFVLSDGFYNTLRLIAEEYIKAEDLSGKTQEEIANAINNKCYSMFDGLFSATYVSKFSVPASSKVFYADKYGVLYNKDKTQLMKYPIASKLEFYEIADGVIFDSAAFLGFSILNFRLYYPENLTVHINDLDTAGLPICKTICMDVSPDESFTMKDSNGEELTYTYGEFFAEYNKKIADIRLQINTMMAEYDKMLAKGEIGADEYMAVKNLANMLFGGYMPEAVFCNGHKNTPPSPDVPEDPDDSVPKDDFIRKPSKTVISYGDAIILHADTVIPEGGYIEWTADNANFSYDDNGTTCIITPAKSGSTTFTAVVYDADGNAVLKDEQVMTSKAGFFDKLIGFFKSIFGLTQTYPEFFGF